MKISSKADAEYTVSYLSYASRSQLQKSANTITSANQSFAFNYFMTNKFALKSLTEHYYVQNNLSSAQQYYFEDFSLIYKPEQFKIDFEIACQNVFEYKCFR